MVQKATLNITSPVGRLVSGSLTVLQTHDYEGNLKVIKSGANAGKARPTIDFCVAYPKTPGHADWKTDPALGLVDGVSAPWFPAIAAFGAANDGMSVRPDFSWKIHDGDSTMPNKKGNKNVDKEGWPGHWVVVYSNSGVPKCLDYLNAKGDAIDGEQIKRGYFVQVMAEVLSNQPSATAGIYTNHRAVALIAYGPIISGGEVDVSKAGFGQGIALPAGATTTPPAAVSASAPQPAPAPAPAPVTPAHDLVAAGPTMTAAAQFTYAEYKASGWTDEQLRSSGFMV